VTEKISPAATANKYAVLFKVIIYTSIPPPLANLLALNEIDRKGKLFVVGKEE